MKRQLSTIAPKFHSHRWRWWCGLHNHSFGNHRTRRWHSRRWQRRRRSCFLLSRRRPLYFWNTDIDIATIANSICNVFEPGPVENPIIRNMFSHFNPVLRLRGTFLPRRPTCLILVIITLYRIPSRQWRRRSRPGALLRTKQLFHPSGYLDWAGTAQKNY